LIPPATYDERILLARTATGDEAAFTELFAQHRDRVYSIAMRVLQFDEAAKDVVQETFINVWTYRQRLPDVNDFKAWISTVARNILFKRLRRQSYEVSYLKETIYTNHNNNPEQLFDSVRWNEMYNLLLQAVQLLAPQQRKVFELGRFEGMKHEEIADLLGISKESVKKHMMVAVKRIREHFDASGHGRDLLMAFISLEFFLHTTPEFFPTVLNN
jgi:RNA polymerase sigma-70 factor (ECF subfamily)